MDDNTAHQVEIPMLMLVQEQAVEPSSLLPPVHHFPIVKPPTSLDSKFDQFRFPNFVIAEYKR